MNIIEATALIRTSLIEWSQPQYWCDLGCGSGTFTMALAHVLSPGSTIHAVDWDQRALENLPNHYDGVPATQLWRSGSSESRLQLHWNPQALWPVFATRTMHQCSFPSLIIHRNEPTRQRARELANTPEFASAQRERKKVEALFAELKNQIGLRRLRLRRLRFVREQFFLAAAAQNLKRLVRFLSQTPEPPLPAIAQSSTRRKLSVSGLLTQWSLSGWGGKYAEDWLPACPSRCDQLENHVVRLAHSQ
jgi:hypothetical protein